MVPSSVTTFLSSYIAAAKKGSIGKSKEELTLEKRRELERRLQDVSGQLNSVKKPTKPKGKLSHHHISVWMQTCLVFRATCSFSKLLTYCALQ